MKTRIVIVLLAAVLAVAATVVMPLGSNWQKAYAVSTHCGTGGRTWSYARPAWCR